LKKKGSAYYEIIIKTMVFITLIATAISFFGVFTTYLNLNYAARRVTRDIEISGQVSTGTYTLFNEMKTNTNIGPGATMNVSATYFNAAQRKNTAQRYIYSNTQIILQNKRVYTYKRTSCRL